MSAAPTSDGLSIMGTGNDHDSDPPPDSDDGLTTSGIFLRPTLEDEPRRDEDKVARLRRLIAAGELPIDAAAIASAVLARGLLRVTVDEPQSEP